MNNREEVLINKLAHHGLRNTPFRRQVLDAFMKYRGEAVTIDLVEVHIGEHDRITLYRTIKSFIDKGIIHQTVDQHGHQKYALCDHHCDEHSHHDEHIHFECDQCKRMLCVDVPVQVANFDLPHGFKVSEVKVSMTGLCVDCAGA